MEWRVRCWVRATVVTSCKRQKTQTPQRTSADKTWTVVLLQSSLRCTNTNKNNRDNLRFIDKVGIQNYRRYDILILPAFAFLSVVLYGSWRGEEEKEKHTKKESRPHQTIVRVQPQRRRDQTPFALNHNTVGHAKEDGQFMSRLDTTTSPYSSSTCKL
jgi:hypothetical protein